MNAVAAKADIVRDYEHWTNTDWLNKNYYYDAKVPLVKKLALIAIKGLMRSMMRKVYKGY